MVRLAYGIYSMAPVDVRIGVTYSAREIELQLADDTDREELREQIDETLCRDDSACCGSPTGGAVSSVCPSAKVAYVELGSDGDGRSIGFSS